MDIFDFNQKANENFLSVLGCQEREIVQKIFKIHEVLHKFTKIEFNSTLSPFFLVRAHSLYLSSMRVGLGGQIPDSYPLLRCALEQSLYAFYLFKNPNKKEIWIKRMDSESHKKEVKKCFVVKKMIESLSEEDSKLHKAFSELYENFIDYGAHPNIYSVVAETHLEHHKEQSFVSIQYLYGDSLYFKLFLKDLARTGLAIIWIFKLIEKSQPENLISENDFLELSKDL